MLFITFCNDIIKQSCRDSSKLQSTYIVFYLVFSSISTIYFFSFSQFDSQIMQENPFLCLFCVCFVVYLRVIITHLILAIMSKNLRVCSQSLPLLFALDKLVSSSIDSCCSNHESSLLQHLEKIFEINSELKQVFSTKYPTFEFL